MQETVHACFDHGKITMAIVCKRDQLNYVMMSTKLILHSEEVSLDN